MFQDAAGAGFVFNPINAHVLPIPQFPATASRVMWDAADWGVFAVVDGADVWVHAYSPLTINGPQVSKLGPLEIRSNGDMALSSQPTRLPPGHLPILVHDGLVTAQTANGQLSTVVLATHDRITSVVRLLTIYPPVFVRFYNKKIKNIITTLSSAFATV